MPPGTSVLLDPLRDGVRQDRLNVLVSPAVAVVREDRTVPLTVMNPHDYPVRIPELSVLAEFEYWNDTDRNLPAARPEYTTEQIMEQRVHMPMTLKYPKPWER